MKMSGSVESTMKISPRSERGISLVELMVGLTLGLIVVGALMVLYLNVIRTNTELARTSVQIENGRFATNLIREDMLAAGYWGTYSPKFDNLGFSGIPNDIPTEVPSPCLVYQSTSPVKTKWTDQEVKNLTGTPVSVYTEVPTGCDTLITNLQPNTDIVVVRRAEACAVGDAGCDAFSVNTVYVQSALDVDCETAGSYPALQLEHRSAVDRLRLKKRRDCSAAVAVPTTVDVLAGDAPLRKYVSNIYWVRNYSVTAGDGIPTLMRSQFGRVGTSFSQMAGQPLVDGIESLRVELGVDNLTRGGLAVDYTQGRTWADPEYQANPTNRGDGVVDGSYVRCTGATSCTVSQLVNVMSARLFVLARARDASTAYTDTKTYQLSSITGGPTLSPGGGFRRHLFSTTIRLMTPSGRRETP